MIPERVAFRAYSRWEKSTSGCLISTYSTGSHGYAQIGWQDENFRTAVTTAHRAAWVYVNGQISDDLTVDHRPTCDRRCVNVYHLRLLTNFENARRTSGRDWPLGECINSHPNSELVQEPSGRRRCKICRREKRREQRRRAKESKVG